MIILLRLRNLMLFALIVLSLSFIYIGYTGFGNNSQVAINSELPIVDENYPEKFNDADIAIEVVKPVLQWPASEDIEDIKNLDDFFVNFRMERDRRTAAQIEILQEAINNPHSSQEIRQKAQEEIFTISKNIALEVQAENLLKAKGFLETVVIIKGDKTTVVVNKMELEETDMVRIGDLVLRATDCSLENIAIIPMSN